MGLFTPVSPPLGRPLPYGLVNGVTLVKEDNDRWVGGYAFQNDLCHATINGVGVCSGTVAEFKAGTAIANVEITPIVIQAEYECTTFGFNEDERRAKARDQLELCTSKALEYELWTGTLSIADTYGNQYLTEAASVTDLTPVAGPTTPKSGLAILEQALADCSCGTVGTIHMTRGLVPHFENLLTKDDAYRDALFTLSGNMVVLGSGYTGSAPGDEPGCQWIYATGPVAVRLGDIEIVPDESGQAVDRSINSVTYKAERFASAAWTGCCHFGIQVTP